MAVKRASWIGAPEMFNLTLACEPINRAFGMCYLVGSALHKRDYRDVDVRCILDDEEFDRLFPNCPEAWQYSTRWSVMCASVALWLAERSKLPVDFQFQRRTEANRDFPTEEHPRNGLFHVTRCGDEQVP